MQDFAHSSVSDIAREVQTLAQSLKEAIKRHEGLEKEVEFKRKSLRKQHLKLLLLYPTSKEAKDVETHIWMQTSYQFISLYKQHLAVLDKKLFSPAAESNKGTARQDPGGGGHVEYRKILGRFRQFLAEEERFYVQLLVRFQSQFDLTEARPALVRTEILSSDEEDAGQTDAGRNLFPELTDTTPRSSDEREVRLAAFTKLLVCLGDIARYREQYNDGGGRPRAGHEEGPPRKVGRGGRRGGRETVPRPRNYTRARIIYEQARLLLPNDGNASHQLAILSSYQKDSFGSLLHYYRALCVRQPYDTASDNLNTVLKKALDQYRASKGVQAAGDDPQAIQKVRLDRFLELVVVLHGLWYLDSDEHATRASKHARHVISRFKSLVSEPALPPNVVSEVIVLAFSALWKFRMIRDKHIRTNRKVIEPLMTTHILALSRTLFETATEQLAVKIDDIQDRGDLAQQITAVFRRILPAIRITSKWLRTNMNYVSMAATSDSSPQLYRDAIKAVWESYAIFLTSLSETFPLAKLPILKNPLDEDVELIGFSPIKRALFIPPACTENGLAPGQDEVHPNEEYLMRISDVLRDADHIVALEKTPISIEDGKFVVSKEHPVPDEIARAATPPIIEVNVPVKAIKSAEENDEDDNMSQTTRTDDDVVRDAFNEALRSDHEIVGDFEDEEDEVIVWSPPKMHLSPLQKIAQPPYMSPRVFPSMQSPTSGPESPAQPAPPVIPSSGTTAQDLLNNVLGFSRSKSELTSFGNQQAASSSIPQSSLLFGSGSFNMPTKSIWSSGSEQLGQSGHVPHLPTHLRSHLRSDSLAPAHERMRSQSLSRSQPSLSQSPTQDSVNSGLGNASTALPVGHLGTNYGRFGGHQHSMSFSGSHDALRVGPGPAPTQVLYDSYVSHTAPSAPGPAPPAYGQSSGMQGFAVQGGVPDPFLYYDSQGTKSFAGIGPSAATINQSIWGT